MPSDETRHSHSAAPGAGQRGGRAGADHGHGDGGHLGHAHGSGGHAAHGPGARERVGHARGAAGHAGHAHGPGGHAHGDLRGAGRDVRVQRALAIALALTGGFAVVEAVAAWLAGSLALLSDAGHMITDAASLGLALFAQRIAARPPSERASYGYARAEVLAAFVNALALLALVVFIAVEAVRRLLDPQPVAGAWVLGVAAIGLVVNLVAVGVLSTASGSMNARGALLHVLSDLLGSVAAIIAGAVIVATGWMPIDPILSVVVAALIVRSTWGLLVESVRVLMEGVPAHLDYEAIGNALCGVDGVVSVHDLHVWHTGPDDVALSAHVALAEGSRWLEVLASAQRLLAERYAIRHVTLQPSWPAPVPAGDRRIIPIAPLADRGTRADG
jgi:cobalt-zinc-cadmium efflux system protein